MDRQSGFTAMELATTIAIATVIAAIVMPAYLSWHREHRLRGTVTNLMADLEMAKVRAIRENAFVVVNFDPDLNGAASNRYLIFVDNGEGGGIANNWILDGAEIRLRDRQLPGGVWLDLDGLTLANDRLRINGRGLPPDVAVPQTIPVQNSSDTPRNIIINRLGYIRLQ